MANPVVAFDNPNFQTTVGASFEQGCDDIHLEVDDHCPPVYPTTYFPSRDLSYYFSYLQQHHKYALGAAITIIAVLLLMAALSSESPETDTTVSSPTEETLEITEVPVTAVNISSSTATLPGPIFKVFCIELTWDKAKERCRKEGGELASVHNAKENAILSTLKHRTVGIRPMWLGGIAKTGYDSNQFRWIDDSSWDYQWWRVNYPKSARQYRCVLMDTSATDDWYNESCGQVYPFACKFGG
ncbi:hypothetical protein QR680_011481 [Steinernema hermaphroditum]|uniref:C-type lectin domain-containing protein n=1 Tax=Steinernema hermaphroditum TaxID=289476 RepID=A0AA39HYN2_9BILA|nr:hypothetical protein QR680_011481 [Steinernema hermaphroditum]